MMKSHFFKGCRCAPIITIIIFALIMIPKVALSQNTTIRPIEEFVDAQGTFCFPDGMDGCILFVPPIENFVGFSDPEAGISISVDYAGLADDFLGTLGTEFDGTVIERPLADGRAEVKVQLFTSNALTWVIEGNDFEMGDLLFGFRAPEVQTGETPGLGECFLRVVFINTAPGAPLPDLLQLFIAPEPGQEGPTFLSLRARANGPLRADFGVTDGTPGKVIVTQTGLFMTRFMGAVADGFPVEKIVVKEVGQ